MAEKRELMMTVDEAVQAPEVKQIILQVLIVKKNSYLLSIFPRFIINAALTKFFFPICESKNKASYRSKLPDYTLHDGMVADECFLKRRTASQLSRGTWLDDPDFLSESKTKITTITTYQIKMG